MLFIGQIAYAFVKVRWVINAGGGPLEVSIPLLLHEAGALLIFVRNALGGSCLEDCDARDGKSN